MKLFEAQNFLKNAMQEAGQEEYAAQSRQLLLGVLGITAQRYLLSTRRDLTGEEQTRLRSALQRRLTGEPLQYILGSWEFYGREFACDARALIPREDTQVLVDCALSRISPDARVIDLGTGTGIVGLTLALECPEAHVTCLDISEEALSLARENGQKLGAQGVEFLLGDMTRPLPGAPYTVIVSNPPYIPEGDRETLARELDYEPSLALFAGEDGLDFYRALAQRMEDSLAPGGWILVEVGIHQSQAVAELFAPLAQEWFTENDFAGIPRVVAARKKG